MRNPLLEFRYKTRSPPRSSICGGANSGKKRKNTGFVPQFNRKDNTGNYMRFNLCNSWFHLIEYCPYWTQNTCIVFVEEHKHTLDNSLAFFSRTFAVKNDQENRKNELAIFCAQIMEHKSVQAFTGDTCMLIQPSLITHQFMSSDSFNRFKFLFMA